MNIKNCKTSLICRSRVCLNTNENSTRCDKAIIRAYQTSYSEQGICNLTTSPDTLYSSVCWVDWLVWTGGGEGLEYLLTLRPASVSRIVCLTRCFQIMQYFTVAETARFLAKLALRFALQDPWFLDRHTLIFVTPELPSCTPPPSAQTKHFLQPHIA